MKWLPTLVFIAMISNDPVEIARINGLKKEAEIAFLDQNYPAAINYYRTLIDSIGADDEELFLNLAHAYYESGDTTQARTYYSQASTALQPSVKSIAYQQLGALAKSGQQLQESLDYLKAAIKSDPQNSDARYDFELVKKLLKEQEQQQQDQQDQDQQNQDEQNQEENEEQQNQEQQNQENQEGEQQEQEQDQQQQNPEEQEQDQEGQEQEQQQEGEDQQEQDPKDMSTKEKLEQMNISEEKAQMILEAMRNSEIQYLQQQKRKPSKRPDSGKPDW
ncbi:MAG: hypothetical protein ACO2ZZ_09940 [Cyclobacteriaceae bacterium]